VNFIRYSISTVMLLPFAASAADIEFGGKLITSSKGINYSLLGVIVLGAVLALVAMAIFVRLRIKFQKGDSQLEDCSVTLSRQREADMSMKVAADYNSHHSMKKSISLDLSNIESGAVTVITNEVNITEKIQADSVFGSSSKGESLPLAS